VRGFLDVIRAQPFVGVTGVSDTGWRIGR